VNTLWRFFAVLVVAAPLMVVILFCSPSVLVAQGQYNYFDDFSTDKARTDSYAHSYIADPPCPDFGFDPFLCFNPDSLGNRRLAFYYTFTLEGIACICYRFPVGSERFYITTGVVRFELPGFIHSGGRIDFLHSLDGTNWTHADSIWAVGTYEYVITPPYHPVYLYICLRGGRMLIDNLSVTLNPSTATDDPTWGAIKALFR
jgi:hypothetical protein